MSEFNPQQDAKVGEPAHLPQLIPAKEKTDIYASGHIFRTCAYCRVSTDSDMQISSFELQREHYKSLAGSHPNWDLRKIYADEGISGTSLKKRDQFNEMLNACWRGEYDLILTKSVSRFARNLVDCISLVRKLKNHNPPVGVFFETDNLFTLSTDSELKLSILATFAQEESVKKSESMVWSLSERFKSGKLLTPDLYGYRRARDANGKYIKQAKLEIVENEAKVIQFIFNAFLAGYPLSSIAAILSDNQIPTRTGKKWTEGALRYILGNERYCGSVLTWKTFTADIFEHRKRRNNHDRDQWLYNDDHEAIITVEQFEATQTLLENKKHHVKGGLPVMHVIDDGIFRGYIPVNHLWVNDNPDSYFEASNSVDTAAHTTRLQKKYFSAFNFSGYQVVRGQFLTLRPECPCLSVTDKQITFNAECMRQFRGVEYVQLLLHPTERKLAIRPCSEKDVHSIKWSSSKSNPATSKTLSCQYFANCLFRIMGWNPDYRYRVRGNHISHGSDEIIVFDVTQAMPGTVVEESDDGSGNIRKSRVEFIPEEWSGSFGAEFYDFCLQNGLYYITLPGDWKAHAKSHAVSQVNKFTIMTDEELQGSLSNLRLGAGVSDAASE